MEATKLLKPTDVAAFLGMTVETLANWRCYGHGPAYCHVGRSVRYREADVLAWLEAQQ